MKVLVFLSLVLLSSCDLYHKQVFSRLKDDVVVNGETIKPKDRRSVSPDTLREIHENYYTTEDMTTVFINSAHITINIIITE